MAIVLVHGNPETAAVWDPLVAELKRSDVVRLSPPGFGAPLPEKFTGYLDYRQWLEDELAEFDHPVDLVGHDWGGIHVMNVVMHRPELVRSWASDTLGVFHHDYVWNNYAQAWQRSGEGEKLLEQWIGGSIDDRTGRMLRAGMPIDVARRVAAAQGPEMGRAILMLYRSAAQPALADAGRNLARAAARPGLSLLTTDDLHVGSTGAKFEVAAQAGARIAVVGGASHRWIFRCAARGAAALNEFWDSLDSWHRPRRC
ncbi:MULTISPECIES: alpha/beta hydrolase [unclassified Rhodococcus (in: high G+C Gram-positive bacteria)]|uniref:alpha/beta hydrolase n=1 Tax=unclassified Rhodococcus (in: high G+C Gram-positive bacteria) TaxID=192944 RepID=UPI0007BC3B89|nr:MULTISPECIES: alpha/beta hydrolase [unclassified Rhodococcus (in: high G+C Gram-positive bacteria)]KZE98233.1 alpha/beta hydrolase [Rhodococcus sp. EPR-147]KZF06924.1 alpha/beta hydrolase [Rhodococcus sp. EPR-279]